MSHERQLMLRQVEVASDIVARSGETEPGIAIPGTIFVDEIRWQNRNDQRREIEYQLQDMRSAGH